MSIIVIGHGHYDWKITSAGAGELKSEEVSISRVQQAPRESVVLEGRPSRRIYNRADGIVLTILSRVRIGTRRKCLDLGP